MAKRSKATTPAAPGGAGPSQELKHRLLFVLGALVVFRIGSFIPVPGINSIVLADLFEQQRGTILDMFNMFSGGALARFSIFAIGVMPYISASIIMQLLSHVEPKLKELRKEGEAGRRTITRWTRYATVVLSDVPSLRRCDCPGRSECGRRRRGDRSRLGFSHHNGRYPGDRYSVLDVAG